MIITISAERFCNGLREYTSNRPIPFSDTTITEETWNKLQDWLDRYELYLPMTLKELEPYLSEIEDLDNEGVKLLNRVSNEWNSQHIEYFLYQSLCREFNYKIDK